MEICGKAGQFCYRIASVASTRVRQRVTRVHLQPPILVQRSRCVLLGTVRPTKAYMSSRLEATISGSCARLQGRIIESFIALIGDLMVSRGLCQPLHRCRIRNTFVYCADDSRPPPAASDGAPLENLTVDFVLEMELKPGSIT